MIDIRIVPITVLILMEALDWLIEGYSSRRLV